MSRVTIIDSPNENFLKTLLESMSKPSYSNNHENKKSLLFVAFLRGLRPYICKSEFIAFLKGRFEGLNFVKIQKHQAYLYFRSKNECDRALGNNFIFRGCKIEIVKYRPFTPSFKFKDVYSKKFIRRSENNSRKPHSRSRDENLIRSKLDEDLERMNNNKSKAEKSKHK